MTSILSIPKKDTLRVLISWKCNLKCSYCCNDTLPEIRASIRPTTLEELDFALYNVVCISGGEPLLFLDRVKKICERSDGKFIVLYTNGTLMTPEIAGDLATWGVNAINVGLHQPSKFHTLIRKVYNSFQGLQVSLRFHLEDTHTDIALQHPGLSFRFWHRDDCERDNEDRVVLTEV
jgi:molybdenum cofactor biosynthesis enzyme MoaA